MDLTTTQDQNLGIDETNLIPLPSGSNASLPTSTNLDEPNKSMPDPYNHIPDDLFIRIFEFLSLHCLKNCRLVYRRWYNISLSGRLLRAFTCFAVDGRSLDPKGSRIQNYLHTESKHGLQPWSSFRLLKCTYEQVSWLCSSDSDSITTLDISNCSLSWLNTIQLLLEFTSLVHFTDVQDMYCWDYASFAQGLEGDPSEFPGLKAIDPSKLEQLQNLRSIKIHRSQLGDCSLYMKIFGLYCNRLQYVAVTTDQSLSPRPTNNFYSSLSRLIQQNIDTLECLWFPYKSIYPIYELRVAEDHFPFRDFLNFISENQWGNSIQPKCLRELGIQFPVIHIQDTLFREKLLPFLSSWTTLEKLVLNCIYLEPGQEHVILESIPSSIKSPVLGLWWSDVERGEPPVISHLKDFCQTITIQPFRLSLGRQLKSFIPLHDPNQNDHSDTDLDSEQLSYPLLTEFQFFTKSPHFRFFNVDLLTQTFGNLTHLNLVDHNSRVDRSHASESPCTIEDDDLQLIIRNLARLTFLQLIGNLVYLTDFGLTGISPQASRRMLKQNEFTKLPGDETGLPVSYLQGLKAAIFRGVGIKVTDVTALYGFNGMPKLRKLHFYGSQQVRTFKLIVPIANWLYDTGFPSIGNS